MHGPRLVLLDEVHIYEGTTGAQNAILMRRLRHVVDRPITWVGLSATLLNADRFLEQFVLRTAEFLEFERAAVVLLEKGEPYVRWIAKQGASRSDRIHLPSALIKQVMDGDEVFATNDITSGYSLAQKYV